MEAGRARLCAKIDVFAGPWADPAPSIRSIRAPRTSCPLTTTPQQFTVLDWIGAVITGLTIVGLMMFPIGSFRTMFQDFGSPHDLPLLTRVALFPGFPLILALPAVVAFVLGLRPRHPLSQRRMWIVAAFSLGCLGSALCLVAMYLPIFTLAGNIKAD
jgi:hypothetical protein